MSHIKELTAVRPLQNFTVSKTAYLNHCFNPAHLGISVTLNLLIHFCNSFAGTVTSPRISTVLDCILHHLGTFPHISPPKVLLDNLLLV